MVSLRFDPSGGSGELSGCLGSSAEVWEAPRCFRDLGGGLGSSEVLPGPQRRSGELKISGQVWEAPGSSGLCRDSPKTLSIETVEIVYIERVFTERASLSLHIYIYIFINQERK